MGNGLFTNCLEKIIREDRNNSNKYLEKISQICEFLDRINTVADSDLLNVYNLVMMYQTIAKN